MKTVFISILFMGLSSFALASGYENNYQCVTLQGAETRVVISIVEKYNSEYELLSASATVNNEKSGAVTVEVKPSSKPHSSYPDFQVLTWTAEKFVVEGYLSVLDARRNFTGYYSSSESQSPLALSCFF